MATPRVVISTRSSPLLSLRQWRELADAIGCNGIDLDIAQSVRHRIVLRDSPVRVLGVQSMRAVWIADKVPNSAAGICEGSTLVVPLSRLNGGRKSQTPDSRAMNKLRQDLPNASSIALAITPVNHEGTRSHLDRISALRHVAEEWDLDIALDLTGDVDPRWEVEAAMLRLGDRLKLVRFIPPSFDRGFFRPDPFQLREVSVARVLAAIADFGFGPVLSLKVRVPFWEWTNPVAIAQRCAIARNSTLAKFQSKSGSLPTPPRRVG